jgi:hypothetical protein
VTGSIARVSRILMAYRKPPFVRTPGWVQILDLRPSQIAYSKQLLRAQHHKLKSNTALPREAREANDFNVLPKSLGKSCLIELQCVSARSPKPIRPKTRQYARWVMREPRTTADPTQNGTIILTHKYPTRTPLARLLMADPGTEMIEHHLLAPLRKSERLSEVRSMPPSRHRGYGASSAGGRHDNAGRVQ